MLSPQANIYTYACPIILILAVIGFLKMFSHGDLKLFRTITDIFSVILVIFLLLLIVQLKLWLLNKLTFSCKYNEDDVASELQWPISVVICITVQIPHHLMHFLTVIHKQSKLENCSNNKSQGRFHSLAN